ncbi:MAG: peptidoglycan-binding protein [Thermodesulfovibrionales bacterium]|nr:peptidoglycan-binding protein [Thermodesulfovibrionales bacterium]
MSIFKIGSKGSEVIKIQEKLKALGYYRGLIDGIFGGGTESAVKIFQKNNGLKVDGQVGPITWKALFNEEIPEPSIVRKPLDYKCLALTGSFETGKDIPECFAGLSGDFDGQGMSFGVLQWNFGQNSLQPLLKDMINRHPHIMGSIFHENYETLLEALNSDKEELMSFVRSIQHPVKHYIYEPWRGMFKSLGRTEEFQNIQLKYANDLYKSALNLCSEYGLWSERAVALMFDIKVQNGSISNLVKTLILNDFKNLPADLSEEEKEVYKMRIVANRRAEASNPRWIEDVRARKLCCANGGGIVHGTNYDLEQQFGIGLKRINI